MKLLIMQIKEIQHIFFEKKNQQNIEILRYLETKTQKHDGDIYNRKYHILKFHVHTHS